MNYFDEQNRARRQSKVLILLFLVAVAGVVFAMNAVFLTALAAMEAFPRGANVFQIVFSPYTVLITFVTLFVIGVVGLFRYNKLRGGGASVAEWLGGRPVDPATADPLERQLLEVVEEMSLAAGCPVPDVYVLDGEPGINAFAAGLNTDDAVVAVTKGTLEVMDRDELQGIIGHEFSHILHGDMVLNVRMISVLAGIAAIGTIGAFLLQIVFRGRIRVRGKAAAILLVIIAAGLAMWLIGLVGVLFSRLIQSALSRNREYLADASAAQFTANPEGIAKALKKIWASDQGSTVEAMHAGEASHFFFGSVKPKAGWFSTHPALEDRIARLQPGWSPNDDEEIQLGKLVRERLEKVHQGIFDPSQPSDLLQDAVYSPLAAGGQLRAAPAAVVASVGEPSARHVQYAREVRKAIPPELVERAHDPDGAMQVVFALLLDRRDEQVRMGQVAGLKERLGQETSTAVVMAFDKVFHLPERERLPLLEMALPTLRRLDESRQIALTENMHQLIWADQVVERFEAVLEVLVWRELKPGFRKRQVRYGSVPEIRGGAANLLTLLAIAGSDDAAEQQVAYAKGMAVLGAPDQPMAQGPMADPQHLREMIEELDWAAPDVKQELVRACTETVLADGIVVPGEAEFLRAVCRGLGVPMPPMLPATVDA